MPWHQVYDPLGSALLSTLVAALPVVVLLGSISTGRIKIHYAALLGLAVALGVATAVYGMPAKAAAGATLFGAAYGLFPIGWIILNLMFLYKLTVEKGLFAALRGSLSKLTPDPRVQVILIAFSFGAFFEGAAGFGTPVAICAAILLQLGFTPLQASGLSLIANTAPVAFGSLGTPIIALNAVTGIDLQSLSKMVGRQLPFFSLIVPFWVVWAFAGFRGLLGVWPAALTSGLAFAVPQFLVSNYHGPWLVDIVASISSIVSMVLLLKVWQPKQTWTLNPTEGTGADGSATVASNDGRDRHAEAVPEKGSPAVVEDPAARIPVLQAWVPWILLSAFIFAWGLPFVKQWLTDMAAPEIHVRGIHERVLRVPPVAPENAPPEKAVFKLNILSATGTGILAAALLAGLIMRYSPKDLAVRYARTIWLVRYSLVTIAAMLSLGYVTKYSGTDATLGLALARTGILYPFFGAMLGWLGVALTGSDTASNVLFGSLQKITAEQTGLNPVLMGAANSSGGVMGKMVDAQSIVVASTATNWYGHEGRILRYVFVHSVILAALVGVLVMLQAYVWPFTVMQVGLH